MSGNRLQWSALGREHLLQASQLHLRLARKQCSARFQSAPQGSHGRNAPRRLPLEAPCAPRPPPRPRWLPQPALPPRPAPAAAGACAGCPRSLQGSSPAGARRTHHPCPQAPGLSGQPQTFFPPTYSYVFDYPGLAPASRPCGQMPRQLRWKPRPPSALPTRLWRPAQPAAGGPPPPSHHSTPMHVRESLRRANRCWHADFGAPAHGRAGHPRAAAGAELHTSSTPFTPHLSVRCCRSHHGLTLLRPADGSLAGHRMQLPPPAPATPPAPAPPDMRNLVLVRVLVALKHPRPPVLRLARCPALALGLLLLDRLLLRDGALATAAALALRSCRAFPLPHAARAQLLVAYAADPVRGALVDRFEVGAL
jgi:hypothetical protein